MRPATFGRASGTPPFGISTGQSVNAFCGPACGLANLILDVLLDPFLLGKRLVRDGVISIDVFGAINPQHSKLGYRRETGHGRTVLLLGFGFRCSLSELLMLSGAFLPRACSLGHTLPYIARSDAGTSVHKSCLGKA